MKKTAIILGATGLTGRELLQLLLENPDYSKVKVFSRRSCDIQNPKLEEHICDLLQLKEQSEIFTADEVFCCIGTTKAKTADKELYHSIDYGIPVQAGQLAEKNNIPSFSVISAIGADPTSSVFYSRTKGEMEEALLALKIPNLLIYRPSLIYGKREDKRWAERVGTYIIKGLQALMIGKLRKYRATSGAELAEAMLRGAGQEGHKILFRDDFMQ